MPELTEFIQSVAGEVTGEGKLTSLCTIQTEHILCYPNNMQCQNLILSVIIKYKDCIIIFKPG